MWYKYMLIIFWWPLVCKMTEESPWLQGRRQAGVCNLHWGMVSALKLKSFFQCFYKQHLLLLSLLQGMQYSCNNTGRYMHDFYCGLFCLLISLSCPYCLLTCTWFLRSLGGDKLFVLFAQHLRLSCTASSLILVSAPVVQMANKFEIQTN